MAGRKIQGFSLKPIELRAVARLAEELERGNKSGLVANLVIQAAKERWGADWEEIVSQPTKEETAA
jgi:hypothetical protein